MAQWSRFERTGPKKVRGGIKARSRRGAFASSWWACRWIEVLEGFRLGGRLNRGKTYARKGQVTDLEVRRGRIEARVQGSRSRPYRVRVDFPVIPGGLWDDVVQILKRKPLIVAELLAGRVPEDIEGLFEEAGTSLFPAGWSELDSSCTCPDSADPCKHVAAVFYLLAEALEGDPFLLFRLRGMDREDLLKGMGGGNDDGPNDDSALLEPVELEEDPELFWSGPSGMPSWPVRDEMPPVDCALVLRLGPFPLWRGIHEPMDRFREVYAEATQRARNRLFREE
jgi:uncharacterized Zn finger protein